MTTEQAIQAIRSAFITLSTLSETEVWIADEDMTRPNYDHVWMRIRDDVNTIYPSRSPSNDIRQPRTLRIEFEADGKTAIAKMKHAFSALYLQDDPTVQALGVAGIGVLTTPSFVNVSQLLRNAKEPRMNATISFSYLYTGEVDSPVAATAIVLDGYLEDTLEYTETFEI